MESSRSAALADVRVVSIALNLPGPLAVARLAAAGAHVLKVEPPGGDPLAEICHEWYSELHRGCHVRTVDLKTSDGREDLAHVLADCDLFVSSQRPSALARLGLDPSSLRRVRWLNIVGELARPEVPGHDLTYQARAGLLRGEMPISLFADVMGAERAFAAVLLLLRQPPGTHAQVGLFESLEPLVAALRYGLTSHGGPLGGGLPAYRIYPTREGAIAIAALEPHFRQHLYTALETEEGADLRPIMASRTAAEWEAWAAARDLPMAAVRGM